MAYKLEDLPETLTWIKELNKEQAEQQVIALGQLPGPTLENNRVILREIVVRMKGLKNQDKLEASERGTVNDNAEMLSITDKSGAASVVASPLCSASSIPAVTQTSATAVLTTAVPSSAPDMSTPLPTLPLDASGAYPRHCAPSNLGAGSDQRVDVSDFTAQLNSVLRTVHEQTLETIKACKLQTQSNPTNQITVVSELLRQVRPVSGSDPQELVNFLKQINSVFSMRLGTEKDLILAVLAKTDGPLRVVWSQAVTQHSDWVTLKSRVIEEFFPVRTLREIINERVYRLQRPSESLRDFVNDIQETATLLIHNISEKEIVEIVMQGINPQTRLHLSMQATPQSLAQLQELVRVAAEVANISENYDKQFTTINRQQYFFHNNNAPRALQVRGQAPYQPNHQHRNNWRGNSDLGQHRGWIRNTQWGGNGNHSRPQYYDQRYQGAQQGRGHPDRRDARMANQLGGARNQENFRGRRT